MVQSEDILPMLSALAQYAIDRASIAALSQDKYAVATWNNAASVILDIRDQAQEPDDKTIDYLLRHIKSDSNE